MPDVYEHEHVVLPAEIDALGHANNIAYLGWMQAAALAHSAAQGWDAERYRELGLGWVVRSHAIRYLAPCFAGEAIVVRTWVAGMKRVSSTRKYKIVRRGDGLTLASAETEWAFVNYVAGTIARVPREIIDAFALVEDDAGA